MTDDTPPPGTEEIPAALLQLRQEADRLHYEECYAEAQPLMERALALSESLYGPEHPEVATDLNSLAQLYVDTCRKAEALPLLERALAMDEAAYGPDHPEVANDLNDLAWVYQARGRCVEALPLHERALGTEHPDTAIGVLCLAVFQDFCGTADEAESLYQRAIATLESVLEPEHPTTQAAKQAYKSFLAGRRQADA